MGVSVSSPGASDVGEGHIFITPLAISAVVQGTWAYYGDSNCVTGGISNAVSHNTGDEINFKVFLAAGTYSLANTGISGPSSGKIDVYIDATKVVDQEDRYSAGAVYNDKKTTTGIVIATSGLKTIRVVINGKNVASSAYALYYASMNLWRTA